MLAVVQVILVFLDIGHLDTNPQLKIQFLTHRNGVTNPGIARNPRIWHQLCVGVPTLLNGRPRSTQQTLKLWVSLHASQPPAGEFLFKIGKEEWRKPRRAAGRDRRSLRGAKHLKHRAPVFRYSRYLHR